MIIRQATLNDLDRMLSILKEIREEGLEKYSPLNYDDCSLREMGMVFVNSGIFYLGEINNEIAGFIVGTIEPSIMDKNQLIGVERLWCVKKKYRGSRISLALLKKFEEMCKYRGATHIVMGIIVSINHQSMVKLYNKLGYTHIEEHYAKRFS